MRCETSETFTIGLTNRWSQLLAVAMRAFNFLKQFRCLPRSPPPAMAQLRLVRPHGTRALDR